MLSGLYFSSHEVNQDKRTSLNLTPAGPVKFPAGFSLEAEANFRRGDGYYGYIFRIIGDENTNIDLVSNLASTSSNFWLVLKDKVLFTYQWTDIPNGGFNRWIKIRLDIDVRNSKLSIAFNGKKMETQVPDLAGIKNFNMVFGACRNASFFNTDVSPMSLRNIQLFDPKNNLVRNWNLSKHSQKGVYDEIEHAEALVDNPNWIIDKHIKWHKLRDFTMDSILGISFDEQTSRIFLINTKAVYVLSNLTQAVDTLDFSAGIPYFTIRNQIIYNRHSNELWSYDFFSSLKGKISKFNFATRRWSSDQVGGLEPHYWHHNRFISPVDSTLVTLFGYGNYTYKGIVNIYNESSQSWMQKDCSDQIQPRYLSAFGLLNQKEGLVFGGYGSKTGRQELSPEVYYDLYKLDLNNYTFRKQWTLNTPSLPYVPCESLIADEQNGRFYTLLYNRGKYSTFLRLALFGIENPEYHLYNDSIPYNFLDTRSWSTLVFDQKTSQLIAITSHDSEVALYSIAYPPLMPGDVYQSIPSKTWWYFWLIGFLLAGALSMTVYHLIRVKKNKGKKEGLYEQLEHPSILPIPPIIRKTVSSVLCMGGFQIYDGKARNLTSDFSPTLKQLFLIILLNTIQKGKGISSAKLDEILWSDKFGDSARNNRNVNISKLRSILDEMEGVELINENSFWEIKIGSNVFCDMSEITDLLRKSKSNSLTESEIHQLIALLSIGEFLPAIKTEWMDGFKSQFTSEIVDTLGSLFNEEIVKNNVSLRYHLAESILVYDPLNDEAFAMKCSVLYHLGKRGMAKNLYDSFCREYRQLLGINYAVSFNDTIK